jgi:hypothetical protein
MNRHRAEVPVNTTVAHQPPGRHSTDPVRIRHWYNTCPEAQDADVLAVDEEKVNCEWCVRELFKHTAH